MTNEIENDDQAYFARREMHGKEYADNMRKHEMKNSPKGYHASDVMKAAEELRMEGKGSHDPAYENSKKNK